MTDIFKKRLFWLIVVAVVLIGAAVYLNSTASANFLWKISNNGRWFLPVLIVAALAESLNPCAYSVLLLTVAFLFGIGRSRAHILRAGGVYVLGIFLVYIGIGLGALQALHLFNTPHFMAKVGAIVILVLGAINLINSFFPKFPIKLGIPQSAHNKMAVLMEKGSIPTAFVLGVLVGLCEFPCTGGPYLVVLGLLHDNATRFAGLAYLVLFNLIFILPIVIFLLIASEQSLLEKVQEWKKSKTGNMRFWSGIVMVVLGMIILFL